MPCAKGCCQCGKPCALSLDLNSIFSWIKVCDGVSGGGTGAAGSERTGERMSKGWAEAAATLLGPVAQRMSLTSAFSEALASRGGEPL